MRIKSVDIEGHPVFKKFSYTEFDLQMEPKDVATFFIGQNGSGKSIFLEILVEIFQSVFEDRELPFQYTLVYVLNGVQVTIHDGNIMISELQSSSNDGLLAERKLLKRERADWLPNHVILYYSGAADRSREYFKKEYETTKREIINGELVELPHFFYIDPALVPLILITLYTFEERFKSSPLWERLDLGALDKIEFAFNEVDWYKKNYELDDANFNFWGARGAVGDFLDKLKSATISSKTASAEITIDGEKANFLFFKELKIDGKDIKILKEQFSDPDPKIFFKQLLDLNMSGLIQDIDITISKKDLKDKFSFKYLSEGEKQLLLVLGFLELNKRDNVLFLFDEPDTHLNPIWKYEYFESIMNIVGESSKNTQIFIATHDPLVISGLEKENVIVVTNDLGEIEMEPASSDLFGKGVDSILTSELFGLNSTLDHNTLSKMIDRRKLLVRKEDGSITKEELEQLNVLNSILENIDFNRPFADPLYKDFVMAISNLDVYKDNYISDKEKKVRADIANSIMKRLMEEGK